MNAHWASAQDKTLVVLGDSLSAAYGMADEKGWVALLAKKMKEKNYPYIVINESTSGYTSANGLERLKSIIARRQIDILIVGLGANDGLRGYPLGQMKQNLKQMISLGREAGGRLLLLGVEIPANYGRRYKERFKQVYQETAAQESVLLVPLLLQDVPLEEKYFQDDRLHPNALAQPLILENVWGQLMKLLATESL